LTIYILQNPFNQQNLEALCNLNKTVWESYTQESHHTLLQCMHFSSKCGNCNENSKWFGICVREENNYFGTGILILSCKSDSKFDSNLNPFYRAFYSELKWISHCYLLNIRPSNSKNLLKLLWRQVSNH